MFQGQVGQAEGIRTSSLLPAGRRRPVTIMFADSA